MNLLRSDLIVNIDVELSDVSFVTFLSVFYESIFEYVRHLCTLHYCDEIMSISHPPHDEVLDHNKGLQR